MSRGIRPIGLVLWLTTMCLSWSAHADPSLYERLGGAHGITAIVDDATTRFLADPRIAPVFDNANMTHLRTHLADYVCMLTGGPFHYKVKDMRRVHQGLNITRAQFNALAEDWQDAMEREGVTYTTQNRVLALLAPLQRDIVGQ